eukprot:5352729-Amphidinium_carterae.1
MFWRSIFLAGSEGPNSSPKCSATCAEGDDDKILLDHRPVLQSLPQQAAVWLEFFELAHLSAHTVPT